MIANNIGTQREAERTAPDLGIFTEPKVAETAELQLAAYSRRIKAKRSAARKWLMTTSPRSGEHRLAKAKRVRPRRDFQAMERRRMRAAEMFTAGAISQADIGRRARRLG